MERLLKRTNTLLATHRIDDQLKNDISSVLNLYKMDDKGKLVSREIEDDEGEETIMPDNLFDDIVEDEFDEDDLEEVEEKNEIIDEDEEEDASETEQTARQWFNSLKKE